MSPSLNLSSSSARARAGCTLVDTYGYPNLLALRCRGAQYYGVSKMLRKSSDSAAEGRLLLFWIRAILDTQPFWIRFGYARRVILDAIWLR